jgi:hypothetical protein
MRDAPRTQQRAANSGPTSVVIVDRDPRSQDGDVELTATALTILGAITIGAISPGPSFVLDSR